MLFVVVLTAFLTQCVAISDERIMWDQILNDGCINPPSGPGHFECSSQIRSIPCNGEWRRFGVDMQSRVQCTTQSNGDITVDGISLERTRGLLLSVGVPGGSKLRHFEIQDTPGLNTITFQTATGGSEPYSYIETLLFHHNPTILTLDMHLTRFPDLRTLEFFDLPSLASVGFPSQPPEPHVQKLVVHRCKFALFSPSRIGIGSPT